MGLFKRKSKLKNQYDDRLLSLMNRQKTAWEDSKVMEEIIVEEHPRLKAERKLAQAKYFYLFKEAKVRQIKGK
ncbi:YaaL family protein [Marinilactibacillus sp. Marseille-P9653]|uniref:YaaL family protein n=1 Tax=Marinilactibacillus sp. Marseille-P9653 TaxID=2866583 RepID=UPI001CE4699C|nr:YaaL family protein [Marinilactibacillus sp. Marseille-P9653]